MNIAALLSEGDGKIQEGLSRLRDLAIETNNDEALWTVLSMKHDIHEYMQRLERQMLRPSGMDWPQ